MRGGRYAGTQPSSDGKVPSTFPQTSVPKRMRSHFSPRTLCVEVTTTGISSFACERQAAGAATGVPIPGEVQMFPFPAWTQIREQAFLSHMLGISEKPIGVRPLDPGRSAWKGNAK